MGTGEVSALAAHVGNILCLAETEAVRKFSGKVTKNFFHHVLITCQILIIPGGGGGSGGG